MPDFHQTSKGIVPFTPEEQAEVDERRAKRSSQAEQDRLFNKVADEARRSEYASVGDQLAAIWEVLEVLRPRNSMPAKAKEILDAIDATKAKHPKR